MAVELATRLGVEVEVLSLRSESQTVLAGAEGLLSVEDFGSPIRIQTDPDGAADGWVEVDYDLEETSDGVWAPKASPADVVVNDTVDGVLEAARVTYEDGSAVAVTWPEDNPGELGDPVVEGGVATYPLEGFSGSVDLVVAMTTTGASTWLRINEALTAEETAAIESEGVTFGLRTSGGVDLRTSNDAIAADPTLAEDVAPEALVLTDSEGEAVGAAPPLVAWDSSALDEVGMPTETMILASDLAQLDEAGNAGDSGDTSDHELTVTPPAELLGGTDGAGAGVEYPVIIDPQFENLTQSQDTWIRNGTTALNGSDSKLLVGKHGTSGAAANLAASLLQFQSTVFDGRQIDQAYLGLYQYGAGTCAERTMNVHAIRDPWAQSQATWANQPRFYDSNYASTTDTRAPGCSRGAGYIEARITPIVRDWAHGARPNRGVILSAPASSDTTASRSFCSMDYSASFPGCDHKPYLRVSYSLAIDGQRPGATRLPFTASDLIQAQVDVGTGNLMLGVNGITLPGISDSTSMMATYNSSGGREVRRLGRGWLLENTNDIRMIPRTGTIATADVVFTGPSGRTEEFTTKSTSGGVTSYDTPAGLKADLYRTTSGYELVMRESRTKYVFGAQGGLVEIRDRNGNSTTIEQSGTGTYKNITVQTPAGTNAARTARITTDLDGSSNGTTTIAQGDTSALRSVSFARSGNNATSFTDARGRTTTFTYDANGLMTQIAAPGNVTTQFTYDDRRRVTSVTQVENASGGPGNSVTRFTYPDRHTTLVADPTTNQSALVSEVPHTEYQIDDNNRVKKTVDPEGRERSKTYTPNSDVATSTIGASSGGAGGSGGSTTTNTWNGNDGDSMTETESPTGASNSWAYDGSGMAQYNATSSTDDADNTSTYTYNGAGNQMTSADASEATAEVTRNDDGTVATATSPGNGDNDTNYGYTNHQITSMSPVTGSSLGDRAYTYDTMGRLATVTNGRGITTTYSYNENDQVLSATHAGSGSGSGGDTTTVTYDYDAAGRMNSRTDTHGTTTSTYDQLGRLLTRANTAGGGTITYTYDKASRLTSTTSTEGGTTNYAYDTSGTATGYNYPVTPGSSTRITVRFTTDDKGRRTGTYVAPNANFTTWTARTTNTYDDSGRVTRVRADRGNGTADIIDVTYCYAFGTTPAGGCSDNDDDRAKLAWKKDNLTGDGVRYSYSQSGRLTEAQPTAGGTTYSYDYNAAGARTEASTNSSAGSSTQTLSFNDAQQITTNGYTYDGAGNLKTDPAANATAITYTAADQLNSVTKNGTTYLYEHAGDDNNELLEQTTPEGTYRYTYGRNAGTGVPVVEQIHRTHTTGGTQVTDAAAVITDPVTGTPVMLKTADGIASIYVYDGKPGAPIALISDEAGQAARTAAYTYDPYGAATTATGANPNVAAENPYTFSGNGVRDRTTNWVHYGERYYSTRTGTFTQQDSLDSPLNPTDANRYAYAAGDPVNITDPTGRCGTREYVGAVAGGAATGAVGAVFGGPLTIFGGAVVGGTTAAFGLAVGCVAQDAYDEVTSWF